MDRETIREKVIEILRLYTRKQDVWNKASDQSTILGDLKINSARFVDVVISTEDAFQIEIKDSVMMRILTIEDLIDYVMENATS